MDLFQNMQHTSATLVVAIGPLIYAFKNGVWFKEVSLSYALQGVGGDLRRGFRLC